MIDRVKNYSEIVKEVNFDKKQKPAEPAQPRGVTEVSKRDKMLEFAKRIQRPAVKKVRSMTQQNGKGEDEGEVTGKNMSRQIEFLESQHQVYQQQLRELRIS